MVICWSTGAIPLFPQGIAAGVNKIQGSAERSWFLALYLPGPLQWPMIVLMVLLGLGMYGLAAWLSLRSPAASPE